MKNISLMLVVASMVSVVVLGYGCGKKSTDADTSAGPNIPLLTPPVKSVTPVGFGGGTASFIKSESLAPIGSVSSAVLAATDIKSRFFSAGPTNLFRILADVDGRITEINSSRGNCIVQSPVSYLLSAPGETVTMYGQCYRRMLPASFTGDPSLFQFGINNNLVYLYSAIGAGRLAAIVSPLNSDGSPLALPSITPLASPSPVASASPTPLPSVSPLPSSYKVEVWFTVGMGSPSAYGTGSYGVGHLTANTVTKTFEMTVAGMGFGYCGAHLKSDGTNVYVKGSLDMGTTCEPTDELCVLASDVTTLGSCGADLKTFSLTPLGKKASTTGTSYPASEYPGGDLNIVTLTGAVDSGGFCTDGLGFGPTDTTKGLGGI